MLRFLGKQISHVYKLSDVLEFHLLLLSYALADWVVVNKSPMLKRLWLVIILHVLFMHPRSCVLTHVVSL